MMDTKLRVMTIMKSGGGSQDGIWIIGIQTGTRDQTTEYGYLQEESSAMDLIMLRIVDSWGTLGTMTTLVTSTLNQPCLGKKRLPVVGRNYNYEAMKEC